MNNLARIVCCVCMVFFSTKMHAQLTPWWQEQQVDSTEIKELAKADSIIAYAKTFIGTPYVWGGTDPQHGFDCSGFICYVYKAFNITLPRTSDMQFDAGIPIPYVDARPGDIIVFSSATVVPGDPGHVGIVLDYDAENGFSFIHTSSPETGGVRISNEANEKYYNKHFLEIRRVITAN